MKRQDLRIGNWVRFKKNANYDCTTIQASSFEGKYIEETFEPIEITEGWLLNLGFKDLTKNHGYAVFKHPTFDGQRQLRYSEGSIWIITVGSGFAWELPNIKYVHQLQNMYHALTGEEIDFLK